jgi:hypothetical protein
MHLWWDAPGTIGVIAPSATADLKKVQIDGASSAGNLRRSPVHDRSASHRDITTKTPRRFSAFSKYPLKKQGKTAKSAYPAISPFFR